MRRLPNSINSIKTKGNRIYLGTTNDSFILMKYKPADNQFYAFAGERPLDRREFVILMHHSLQMMLVRVLW